MKRKLNDNPASETSSFGRPKQIRVWENNNTRCYKIKLNPKDLKNWTSILAFLSRKIHPSFGKITKMVSLKTSVSVSCYEELKPNDKYIALGANSTLRTDKSLYRTISETEKLKTKKMKKDYVGEFDPSILPFLKQTKNNNLTIIFVSITGKGESPHKIVFKEAELRDWNFIRNYVAEVVGINVVQHIYTIFGDPLHESKQLQHGCLYVAVPIGEKFIEMDYMSFYGDKNKNKLSEPPIQENDILRSKKVSFGPNLSFSKKKKCLSKPNKSGYGSNYDVYKDKELSNEEIQTRTVMVEKLNKYSEDEYERIRTHSNYASGGSKGTKIEYKKKKPKKPEKLLPSVLENRIYTLAKTIKRYRRKLRKLENKMIERRKPKERFGDIFERYSYDKLTVALENLRPDQKGPIPTTELTEWFDDLWSRGQILLGLCYNTKKRALVVSVVRCVNLLPMDNNGLSDPFVKLQLKPDPNHKKHKTSIKWKNLNPVFNEEFAFETRPTELSTQSLYITVYDKDYGKSNDYLGGLILGGTGSKGLRLKHWMDMIRYPDHRHEQWHNLTEDLLD